MDVSANHRVLQPEDRVLRRRRTTAETIKGGYEVGAGKRAMRKGVAIAERRAKNFKLASGMLEGAGIVLSTPEAYKNFTECESHP